MGSYQGCVLMLEYLKGMLEPFKDPGFTLATVIFFPLAGGILYYILYIRKVGAKYTRTGREAEKE